MTTPQRSSEYRWPNTPLGEPPSYLCPDGDVLHRQAAWVFTLWMDWPQERRDAVRALSGHLAAAIDGLGAALTPGEPRERPVAACEEVTQGLFGAVLGPCVRRGAHRVHDDGQGQTWWRGADTAAGVPGEPSPDRVETAARVLHERRHRAGYAHVCDRCRADAQAVAAALTAVEENVR